MEYNEFIELTSEPTVVDFWAEWCPPCKMFSPVFEQAIIDYPEIKFVKINVDENQNLCGMLGINGIPAVHFYINNMLMADVVGAMNKDLFYAFIDENKE